MQHSAGRPEGADRVAHQVLHGGSQAEGVQNRFAGAGRAGLPGTETEERRGDRKYRKLSLDCCQP